MELSWANWANRITIGRILFIPPFVILMLKMHEGSYGDAMRYAALVKQLSDAGLYPKVPEPVK